MISLYVSELYPEKDISVEEFELLISHSKVVAEAADIVALVQERMLNNKTAISNGIRRGFRL